MDEFTKLLPVNKNLWNKAWLLCVIFIALCTLIGTASAVASSVKLNSVTIGPTDASGQYDYAPGSWSTGLGDPFAQIGVKDENDLFVNKPFYGGLPISGGSLGEVSTPLEYGTHTYTLLGSNMPGGAYDNPYYSAELFFDGVVVGPQIAVYNSNGGIGSFLVQAKDTPIMGSANGGICPDKAPGSSVYTAPDGTKVEVLSYVVSTAGTTDEVTWGEIGPDGNKDTIGKLTLKITPPPAPIADFTASPTSGPAPMQVSFTDASTGGVPTSYKWTFGDGTSSTEKNPVHSFNKAGKYNIGLTVQNGAGSSTLIRNNYIIVDAIPRVPTAAFTSTAPSGVAPLYVAFTDQSAGTPTYWLWDFGDGVTAPARNPVHEFTKAGTYTVKLTVKNSAGSNIKTAAGYVTVSAAS